MMLKSLKYLIQQGSGRHAMNVRGDYAKLKSRPNVCGGRRAMSVNGAYGLLNIRSQGFGKMNFNVRPIPIKKG